MNQLNLFPKVEIKDQHLHEDTATNNSDALDIYKRQYTQISWQQLLIKILIALKVPLIAAKHQFLLSVKTFLNTRPFPWFRVALVLLFAFVFLKKDMQFNINMGMPPAILSEEDDQHGNSKLTMGNFVRTANYADNKISKINLNNADVAAYIKRFTKVAIIEMNKFGIPASIKMGQAILASQAGKNNFANQLNNHFGTTCNGGINCQDLNLSNQAAMVKSYQSAWESWRDHSNLLTGSDYAHLQAYQKNYKKWAKGLEQAGYRNTNNYSQQLIQIIETYQLYKLDNLNENL